MIRSGPIVSRPWSAGRGDREVVQVDVEARGDLSLAVALRGKALRRGAQARRAVERERERVVTDGELVDVLLARGQAHARRRLQRLRLPAGGKDEREFLLRRIDLHEYEVLVDGVVGVLAVAHARADAERGPGRAVTMVKAPERTASPSMSGGHEKTSARGGPLDWKGLRFPLRCVQEIHSG
jgi:hypothetical protein